MFWKLLPLIIEIVRHGGSALVERYRAMKAAEERKRAEYAAQTKPGVELNKDTTQEKIDDDGERAR